MVRRRETRVRTVIPVRVFGMDSNGKPFTALAHTLDITNRGTRIAGLTPVDTRVYLCFRTQIRALSKISCSSSSPDRPTFR